LCSWLTPFVYIRGYSHRNGSTPRGLAFALQNLRNAKRRNAQLDHIIFSDGVSAADPGRNQQR
jgi:hypothetical protein